MKKRFTALLLALLLLFPFAVSADASDQVKFTPTLVRAEDMTQDQWLADSASRARFSKLIFQDFMDSLDDPGNPPIEIDLPNTDSFVGKYRELVVLMAVGKDGRAIYLMYATLSRTASWIIMPERSSDQHLEIFNQACENETWKNDPADMGGGAEPEPTPTPEPVPDPEPDPDPVNEKRPAASSGEGLSGSDDGSVVGTPVTPEPVRAPSAVGTWKCGDTATLEITEDGKARLDLADGGYVHFDWTQEDDILTLSLAGASPVTGTVTEHSLSLTLITTVMDFTR